MTRKASFYELYGVEEYYVYDPDHPESSRRNRLEGSIGFRSAICTTVELRSIRGLHRAARRRQRLDEVGWCKCRLHERQRFGHWRSELSHRGKECFGHGAAMVNAVGFRSVGGSSICHQRNHCTGDRGGPAGRVVFSFFIAVSKRVGVTSREQGSDLTKFPFGHLAYRVKSDRARQVRSVPWALDGDCRRECTRLSENRNYHSGYVVGGFLLKVRVAMV